MENKPEHHFVHMDDGRGFNCFAGNEGDLQFFYDCLQCQGVFTINDSNPDCVKPLCCPICEPHKKHDAHYIIATAKQMVEIPDVFELVEFYRGCGLI